jgi:hypothetical protein
MDPLDILPLEILNEILSGFTIRELEKLRLVSRDWNRFVVDNPFLWASYLDFSDLSFPTVDSMIRVISRAGDLPIQFMYMDFLLFPEDLDVLDILGTNCKGGVVKLQLTTSLVKEHHLFGTSLFQNNLKYLWLTLQWGSLETVVTLLRNFPNLECLSIAMAHLNDIRSLDALLVPPLPNLKRLIYMPTEMEEGAILRCEALDAIIENAPGLVAIKLHHAETALIRNLTRLQTLAIVVNDPLSVPIINANNLQTLRLQSPQFIIPTTTYQPPLPNLIELSLVVVGSGTVDSEADEVVRFYQLGSGLKDVTISNVLVNFIVERCPDIETLTILDVEFISRDQVKNIAYYCPQLTNILLSNYSFHGMEIDGNLRRITIDRVPDIGRQIR